MGSPEGITSAMRQPLTVEVDGPVTYLTLNRPNKLNALDDALLDALIGAYDAVERSDRTRVVVLRGSGRSFCAGADLTDPPGRHASGSDRAYRRSAQIGQRACDAITTSSAVTVAALHGHVLGGGLAIAMANDIRIASQDAVFGYPEVAIGGPLTWGAVPRLISEVGAARAREIVLLGARFSLEQALSYGVVQRATDRDGLDQGVAVVVEALVACPALPQLMTKDQFAVHQQRSALPANFDGDLMEVATHRGSNASIETWREERGPSPQ